MINVMDDAVLEDAKAMSGIFLGAYEDKDLLMIEIMQWIKEHGNASELLTQIVVMVVLITCP